MIGDERATAEVPLCESGVHVRTCWCTTLLTCVRLIEWVHSHTPNFNTILRAVREIWKTGLHESTCRCVPFLTCVKLFCNGSLATYQNWTQSFQPFSRYGKGGVHVRTCRCTTPDLRFARWDQLGAFQDRNQSLNTQVAPTPTSASVPN